MKAQCPKCGKSSFAMEEVPIEHSNFKYNGILCKSCGALICVVDYTNVGAFLHVEMKKQNAAIDSIAASVDHIQALVLRLMSSH